MYQRTDNIYVFNIYEEKRPKYLQNIHEKNVNIRIFTKFIFLKARTYLCNDLHRLWSNFF